ncbi:hypothetical protein HY463_00330 [Candidatus Peregrinibacteria bacterium]|nr:hypothetical protein [Candidatus Peregrinibacteria bacterium]
MSEALGQSLSPEELLGSHEFILAVDKSLPFEEVEFTDGTKHAVAELVLSVLNTYGLELDPNVPKVRLFINGFKESDLVHEGKPCVDLEGKVFIFTTDGPKHFSYGFTMLAENVQMGAGEDA